MINEEIIILIILGIVLLLNVASLICFVIFRKQQWQQKDTEGKVFWSLWMLFIGWIYWLIQGIHNLKKK